MTFPKAWYGRNIARQLFLRNLSSGTAYSVGGGNRPLNYEEAVMDRTLLKHYDCSCTNRLSKSAKVQSPSLNRDRTDYGITIFTLHQR